MKIQNKAQNMLMDTSKVSIDSQRSTRDVVQRLPVLQHSAVYIFISFGIIGPIVVAFKMFFFLYMLEGVSMTAYEESQ